MMKMENEMNVNVPLEIIKASEIEPKEVKWLWYPYPSGGGAEKQSVCFRESKTAERADLLFGR